MNRRFGKKMILALCLLVSLPILAACEDKTPAVSDHAGMSSFTVTTKSGRTIECVSWEGYQKGGLSCDWAAK